MSAALVVFVAVGLLAARTRAFSVAAASRPAESHMPGIGRLEGSPGMRIGTFGCLAAVALTACGSPQPVRLADAIRADGTGLVTAATVLHADSGGDYVEVTLRQGASADDAHALWCRAAAPNGGISEYDEPSSGTYVDVVDSAGAPIVFRLACP